MNCRIMGRIRYVRVDQPYPCARFDAGDALRLGALISNSTVGIRVGKAAVVAGS